MASIIAFMLELFLIFGIPIINSDLCSHTKIETDVTRISDGISLLERYCTKCFVVFSLILLRKLHLFTDNDKSYQEFGKHCNLFGIFECKIKMYF